MDLDSLKRQWDQFGREDPLWAILTDDAKRHGGWDTAEFFETGRFEVRWVLERIERSLSAAGGRVEFGDALDFGCGVGRLTQALCERFERCDGVDIAPSMIRLAEKFNRFKEKCNYRVSSTDDLSMFADSSLDFIYTAHVLQHMEPRYARRYISEFHRILRPGGVMVFEMTTDPAGGTPSPLPDESRRVAIQVLKVPRLMIAGKEYEAQLHVTNIGNLPWPATSADGWNRVTVGNHWSLRTGKRIQLDDGRATFSEDLYPGHAAQVTVRVSAPSTTRLYRLEFDIVQEGVGWFADSGSDMKSATVLVINEQGRLLKWLPGSLGRSAGDGAEPAVMEMYGTPEPEIEKWVMDAGGAVLDVFDWDQISQTRSTDWNRRGFVVQRVGDT